MKKQIALKKIGIWMDHAEAKFIDPEMSTVIQVISSPIKTHVRIPGQAGDTTRLAGYRTTNREQNKNNKKQNEEKAYYKELAEMLKTYDEIFIFGPTMARNEFYNFLMKEKGFSDKKILTEEGNYDTENQIVAQVKKNLN